MASIINATTTAGVSVQGDNSGSLQLATNNGTTAVTIDTSQNVGIGTSSPTRKLTVYENAAQVDISLVSSTTGLAIIQMGDTAADNQGQIIYRNNGDSMEFGVNGAERMRIDSSGNVLVGQTAVDSSGGFAVVPSTSASGAPAILAFNKGNAGNETCLRFKYQGSQVGSISYSNTATAYNTSSDYRLKENIAPMTGAIAVVQQLKPVTYTWKSTGEASQGFIAHELQAVIPDCVTGEKDAVETYTDENGNEQTRINPQGVDTSFLVATLTAAIQELKAELDATKAEVQALKGVA